MRMSSSPSWTVNMKLSVLLLVACAVVLASAAAEDNVKRDKRTLLGGG